MNPHQVLQAEKRWHSMSLGLAQHTIKSSQSPLVKNGDISSTARHRWRFLVIFWGGISCMLARYAVLGSKQSQKAEAKQKQRSVKTDRQTQIPSQLVLFPPGRCAGWPFARVFAMVCLVVDAGCCGEVEGNVVVAATALVNRSAGRCIVRSP